MLIDWFTVGAQVINFLILVWLMKRYLYKPVLAAIDARETRITKQLTDADAKQAEAQKEHDTFQQKNTEFDQQRATLLTKATDDAKVEQQKLLDAARKAADALSANRQEALRSDAQALNQALRLQTQQEVFAIARKALADLATTSLEECMGEVFTRRLRLLDDPAKQLLGDALKTASAPALIRTAFDLPPEQRAAIQNAVNVTFSADLPLKFETAPDLISGIELVSGGQKAAWSMDDYLASLQKGVDALLKAKDAPDANNTPKPDLSESAAPEVKAVPKAQAPSPEAPASEMKSP